MIIVGAGGRDFHDFNVLYRDDPNVEVVAFTAAQIPGIADRTYPPSLAGPQYPQGIRIFAEEELAGLIRDREADEVVFAYSDVTYARVMHLAAIAQGAGAAFTLPGQRATMLASSKPVIAVCATRTGSGKSQTSREVARILKGAGLRVALVRHPMPYHDLERMPVQRFATVADIDESNPTIEEREEYELPVEMGLVMFAGVDYAAILAQAESEADVIIWDGGNNDMPFYVPDALLVVVDPLRAGDELTYYPSEANLRAADALIVNKVDSATEEQLSRVRDDIAAANPDATVIEAASPVTLADGPSLEGRPVLVVEDGPTITHGGMALGAGSVAAAQAGAEPVDPRSFAVGSIADTLRRFPHIDSVLPAMGYSPEQLRDLEETINAIDCEAVITGTPMDLDRVISCRHPIRRTTYEYRHAGGPTLESVLSSVVDIAGRT